jgi:hypothetical protein
MRGQPLLVKASTDVVPMASRRPRAERTAALVARDRRCGPEARRRRASLFVAGLVVLSALLMLVDRHQLERTSPRPAAALTLAR